MDVTKKILSSEERGNLDDSDFAYVGTDPDTEEKVRKLPIHDAAHARNALAILGGARGGVKGIPTSAMAGVKAKVDSAAKKFKIGDYAEKSSSVVSTNDDQEVVVSKENDETSTQPADSVGKPDATSEDKTQKGKKMSKDGEIGDDGEGSDEDIPEVKEKKAKKSKKDDSEEGDGDDEEGDDGNEAEKCKKGKDDGDAKDAEKEKEKEMKEKEEETENTKKAKKGVDEDAADETEEDGEEDESDTKKAKKEKEVKKDPSIYEEMGKKKRGEQIGNDKGENTKDNSSIEKGLAAAVANRKTRFTTSTKKGAQEAAANLIDDGKMSDDEKAHQQAKRAAMKKWAEETGKKCSFGKMDWYGASSMPSVSQDTSAMPLDSDNDDDDDVSLEPDDFVTLARLSAILQQVDLPDDPDSPIDLFGDVDAYQEWLAAIGPEAYIILQNGTEMFPHHNADYSVNEDMVLYQLKCVLDSAEWLEHEDFETCINHLYRHLKELSLVKSAKGKAAADVEKKKKVTDDEVTPEGDYDATKAKKTEKEGKAVQHTASTEKGVKTAVKPLNMSKEEVQFLQECYVFRMANGKEPMLNGKSVMYADILKGAATYETIKSTEPFIQLLNTLNMDSTKVTKDDANASTGTETVPEPKEETTAKAEASTSEKAEVPAAEVKEAPVEKEAEVKPEKVEETTKSVAKEAAKEDFSKAQGMDTVLKSVQKMTSVLDAVVDKVQKMESMAKSVEALDAKVKVYEGLFEKLQKASLGRKSLASSQVYQILEKQIAGNTDVAKSKEGKTIEEIGTEAMKKGASFQEAYKAAKLQVEG